VDLDRTFGDRRHLAFGLKFRMAADADTLPAGLGPKGDEVIEDAELASRVTDALV
jgi:hypothetical protein